MYKHNSYLFVFYKSLYIIYNIFLNITYYKFNVVDKNTTAHHREFMNEVAYDVMIKNVTLYIYILF